jgi:hypothetical protein
MPNTIDGQYILYVLLIFSFLSDIFVQNPNGRSHFERWKLLKTFNS